MKLDREKLYPWLAILRAKFMGSGRAMHLQRHFGSIDKALHASVDAIASIPGFNPEIGQSVHEAAQGKFDRDIEKELTWVSKNGVSILLFDDPDFPAPLRHIPAPPAILYVKGTLFPEDCLSVAIVGSRTASDSGRRMTNKIAGDLADAGLAIISGLAWGIDASAHKGALRIKHGRTIAVLGNGLSMVYPREHKDLADQIVKRGALVTELFYDVSPQKQNFPPRNRIISGLSLGVLVAEAPEKSGSLITANYALDQGKEIFALPGDVEKCLSLGTNRLIQESRATLVTSAEDILRELVDKITFYRNEFQGKIPRVPVKPSPQAANSVPEFTPVDSPPMPLAVPIQSPTPSIPLSEDERQVLNALSADSQHIDVICRQLEWPIARVSAAVGLLELKGVIDRESGMRFRKHEK